MELSLVARPAVERRRAALMSSLGAAPVLLAAGVPRARNYAANTFPFRAHSHFLYFVGWAAPGAMALFDEGRVTLGLSPPSPDDAIWSGPVPAWPAIAEALGVDIIPLAALSARLSGRMVATLPATDAETRARQSELLGRPLSPGALGEADRALADVVIALRLRHDDAAVAELRLAAAVTAHAHAAGMRATRPGIAESVVCAAMEAELTARGCGTAYGSIVTVHGEVLHNEAHGSLLAAEDLLLADVGAETPGGWAGDVTRTWPVSGHYSTEQAEIYDVVLGAQRAAIAAVRPGVRYRDIHVLATEVLARGLRDVGILRGDPLERARDGTAALLFPHGVGHLLGLDVHDMEDLGDLAGYAPGRSRSAEPGLRYLRLDRDLAPAMAVTIEPGIYFIPALLDDEDLRRRTADRVDWPQLERFRRLRGIRIEDDILVTTTGAEVLTASIPKDRNEVETLLSAA
jgi:Xaa-Pro aminopeptidase